MNGWRRGGRMELRLGERRGRSDSWGWLNLWPMDQAMPAMHSIGCFGNLPGGKYDQCHQ